ncbi:hypothetical protein HU200_060108 [Digitaria exilis]|uniref:Uncharacterized protein n=1 Tax=Digitaria exilis TaxID=1010633 RepID=A0A835ACZ4_9POAL|nr:hypothetical protein HU200_060108 [Digitaria exilis]
MEARQQRIIATLLLLTATLFVTAAPAVAHLHPVILLPGYSCSQFDARLTDEYEPPTPACGVRKQGPGWFRLWENYTELQEDPTLLPCYQDQLRLVYDHTAGDYRNVPGVETRVVSFGTTRSFRFDDPVQKNVCMARLVEALEGVGYKEGSNLFGAPYDFRYAPAAPGVAARAFAGFREMNGNKPVIIVTHSFGGDYAMEFLNQSPLPWRRRYVKHFVMLCGSTGGSPVIMQAVASTMGSPPPPTTLRGSVLSLGNRSFEIIPFFLPSPKVFGDTPLVITRAKNYSAENMPEFLATVGFSDEEIARYRTRALPLTLNFRAPLVPMTCISGIGVPTIYRLVYWDGNFTDKPQVVNGDGDGVINVENAMALERAVGGDPAQPYFKSVLMPNTTHNGMISDDSTLRAVVNEILKANQATF